METQELVCSGYDDMIFGFKLTGIGIVGNFVTKYIINKRYKIWPSAPGPEHIPNILDDFFKDAFSILAIFGGLIGTSAFIEHYILKKL